MSMVYINIKDYHEKSWLINFEKIILLIIYMKISIDPQQHKYTRQDT